MRKKSSSVYDLAQEVSALVSFLQEEKHYPGMHDQRTHGNRYSAHPTNSGLHLLTHQGGGKPGVNTHSESPYGPAKPPKPKVVKPSLDHVQPSKAWQDSYHKKQKAAWAGFAKEHGMTLAQYKKAVDKHTKELLKNADIWMRRSPEDLQKILTDGEFKTAFDVGMKPGAKYSLFQRAEGEKNVFGLDHNLDKELRPTYNYLTDNANGGESWRLDGYGSVAIKLKSNLKQYSTVTAEDSLGSTGGGNESLLVPKPIKSANRDIYNVSHSPNPYAPGLLDPLKIKSIDDGMNKDYYRYFEAQTHKRIKTSDIKEVVFTYHPDYATQALLKQQKIKWRVK